LAPEPRLPRGLMVTVEQHRGTRLGQLQQLVNGHLGVVLPGWSLPADVIAGSLGLASEGAGTDPWVARRRTLYAIEDDRLLGAAQVLLYGSAPEVGSAYRGAAELAWLLFRPEANNAAQALVDVARDLVAAWGAKRLYACDTLLPVPVVSGVPGSWPHVSSALKRAGFEPVVGGEEVLYVGRLPERGPAQPPVAGLEVRAAIEEPGHRFIAELAGIEVGFLDWVPDLSFGRALPALAGWAQLSVLGVREGWRGHGIGPWLVRSTAPFLQMLGVRRIVVALSGPQETAGAGSMCRRLGWEPLVRLQQGWSQVG
jgi:GNAT superfamily N-acetyltransferase